MKERLLYRICLGRELIRNNLCLRKIGGERIFGGKMVTRFTDLCIEGASRSGNTFATFLVGEIWPELTIAHHTHSSVNFEVAVRLQIPAIVLVREPRAAIVSAIIRQNSFRKGYQLFNASNAIARYAAFYRKTLALKDRVELVTFDDVIKRPEQFIERVSKLINATTPSAVEVSLAQAKVEIRLASVAKSVSKRSVEDEGWLPSNARMRAKASIEQLIDDRFSEEMVELSHLWSMLERR